MAGMRMPLDKWFMVKVDKFNKNVRQVAEEISSEGELMVKGWIETSGTGRTWKRTYYKRGKARWGSYPGRVWTGDMLKDIEHEVVAVPGTTIASYGWINNYQDYYGLQEGGFTQAQTGIEVEGMFVMADAVDQTQQSVKRKMGKVLHEF